MEVTTTNAIEAALIKNDLSKLSEEQRLSYFKSVCESLGLNPKTQPFSYITLNGKLTLYAKRDATDQLRNIHKVSIEITSREKIDDIYIVTAKATNFVGRCDESIGAVNIHGLKGDYLANAIMKAETKAKRRVTLSICGLGILDESEIETLPPETVEPRKLKPAPVLVKEELPNVDYAHKNSTPTEKQLKRLYAITRGSNWEPGEVTQLMNEKFNKMSSKDLNVREYEWICSHIESNPKTGEEFNEDSLA